jgi:putative oxidoreductase
VIGFLQALIVQWIELHTPNVVIQVRLLVRAPVGDDIIKGYLITGNLTMKTLINRTSHLFYNRSFGLLLIRLGIGLLFFTHGLMKLQALPMTTTIFVHFGFYPWIGPCIALLEAVGGLALIIGVATRLFALLFAVEMFVASVFIVGFGRGINTEFVLMLVALFKMECEKCGGMMCKGAPGVCPVV